MRKILLFALLLFATVSIFASEYNCPATKKLPVSIAASDSAGNAIHDITITSVPVEGEVAANVSPATGWGNFFIDQPSGALGRARLLVTVGGTPYDTFFVNFVPGPPSTYTLTAGTPVSK